MKEDKSTSQEPRTLMSPAEFDGEPDKEGGETTDTGEYNDSLASKLSQELSNWRRKRTSSRPKLLLLKRCREHLTTLSRMLSWDCSSIRRTGLPKVSLSVKGL